MIALIAVAVLAAAPQSPVIEPPSPPPMPPVQELTPAPSSHPDVPPEPHGSLDADLGEHPDKETPGSQFGVVGLLAATLDVGVRARAEAPLAPPTLGPDFTAFGGTAAIGVRYGFFERASHRQWMPAVAALVGTGFGPTGISPFLEARMEYLSVSPGGPLQPNFTVYGSTGLTLSRFSLYAAPTGVRPHVGFGIGWNWFPKGAGAGGSWSGTGFHFGGHPGAIVAIPVALGIAAMVFAGRVEVQYTARPVTGPGSDFVSVVLGVGG